MQRHNGKSTLGFQFRLLAIVAVAFVPIFLLIISTFFNLRKAALEVTEKNLVRFVSIIELTQLQALASTNELLIALSKLPEVKDFDEEKCSELFATIKGSYTKYTNLGVADVNGNVICSATELTESVNISDRSYFRGAVENKISSIGEYEVGKTTGVPEINFAYPVLDDSGELQSVVYAEVGLDWVNSYIETTLLPQNTILLIVDKEGKILVSSPNKDLVGETIPYKTLYEDVLTKREGVVEAVESDQIPRLYAFGDMQVGSTTEEPDAYIILGIDKRVAFSVAEADYTRSLLVLSGLLILGLAVAWVIGGRLIRQQVRYLEEIEKARKKEAELNEILKLLNKILRHDILNDLTVATGNISMYFEGKEQKEDITEVLKNIKEAMDRGISFIHKMKELEGAVSTGKKLEPTDINDVLTEVVKEHPDMVVDVSGEGTVLADQALSSVLDNLIKNAKVHGGVDKVGVRIESDDKSVKIRVADQGKGIPDEIKKQLFEEGFKYGETGHTGMGLHIVRKTIERYGGTVDIENNSPQGTIFVISLPKDQIVNENTQQ